MVEITAQKDSNIIYTVSSGKLSTADYDLIGPKLKETIDRHEKIRWYFEMKDFEGWEPNAFWRDLKMDIKHYHNFEKIAMVGDKKWENWMTQLMKPFTPATIKYFDIAEKKEAKEWIAS